MHSMQPNINLYVFFYKRLCMHPVHVQPYRNLFYESMQLCNMHPYAFNKEYYCSYGLILDLYTYILSSALKVHKLYILYLRDLT